MAHDDQSTCFSQLLQLPGEPGFNGITDAIEILMNEAAKLQRAEALGARPRQPTETRARLTSLMMGAMMRSVCLTLRLPSETT